MMEATDESRHVAELLEITGAAKLSATTQLQVAAMKARQASDVAHAWKQLREEHKHQEVEAVERSKHSAVEGFRKGVQAVQALNKLKVQAKAVSHFPLSSLLSYTTHM